MDVKLLQIGAMLLCKQFWYPWYKINILLDYANLYNVIKSYNTKWYNFLFFWTSHADALTLSAYYTAEILLHTFLL